jgi:dTDP-4-dehydrorhamnose reductase
MRSAGTSRPPGRSASGRCRPAPWAKSGAPSLPALRGLYHLVNSGAVTWRGFTAEILRQAGIDTPVVAIRAAELAQTAERPAYSVLDNGKLSAVAGTMPDWRDALARYLDATGHRACAGRPA